MFGFLPEFLGLIWPLTWFISGDKTIDMESNSSQQNNDLNPML
jgi:hypothetical protein